MLSSVFPRLTTDLAVRVFPGVWKPLFLRLPWEGNGNPLQYSCLENPMDRGAWWATVHELQRVGHDWAASLSLSLSQDRAPSLPLLSLFLSFIFCPTSFRRQWAAFLGAWCPLLALRSCFVEFTQRLNVLLMNLLGRKWSPHPIPPPSQDRPPLILF